MDKPVPECSKYTLKEMTNKVKKIEETLYGSNGRDIVSRIISKLDTDSLQNKLNTIIAIGYILITLVIVGILLQCIFQSQLADVSQLSSLL